MMKTENKGGDIMKKVICMILCFCLVLGSAGAVWAAEAPNYLALGDSITAGTGLNEGKSCFSDLLAAANGYELENLGVNGNTAPGLMAQFAGNALDEKLAAADLITITCGGNDMLDLLYEVIAAEYNAQNDPDITPDDVIPIMVDSGDSRRMKLLLVGMSVLEGDSRAGIPAFADREEFQETLDTFVSNLLAVTAYITSVNPNVPVIITTQYNPYQHFSGLFEVMGTSFEAGARKLNAALAANAENGGYLIADVYSAFDGRSDELCNPTTSPLELDFHPNAAGHRVIAEVIQQVIDSLPEFEEPTEPEPTEPEPTEPEPTEPEPTEPGKSFADVAEDSWYYEAVSYVSGKGLMQGVSSIHFAPDAVTSRAMIATILWRQAGEPEAAGKNPFADVRDGQWYTEAVAWCSANGIVAGYGNGKFGPNDSITREQLASMLYRWAVFTGADVKVSGENILGGFRDEVSISAYAVEAVTWAVDRGIINGIGNGFLAPKGQATRAQTAQMLMVFLKG